MSIQKMSVERNEYGFWTHPEVLQLIGKHRTHDLYFNEFQIVPFLKCAVGCHIETVSMYDFYASKMISCCVESERVNCSQWEPEPPTESSFLLSIHDTNAGPMAWFAVPEGKQAIESSELERLREQVHSLFERVSGCEISEFDESQLPYLADMIEGQMDANEACIERLIRQRDLDIKDRDNLAMELHRIVVATEQPCSAETAGEFIFGVRENLIECLAKLGAKE